MKYKKIAVVMGGNSSEREVSLKSGAAVLEALVELGFNAISFDPKDQNLNHLKKLEVDFCFLTLHGGMGENGTIQGVLDYLEIPYTGSGVMASALAMDKLRSKMIWQAANLPIANYKVITKDTDFNAIIDELGLPLFIKPAREGSSIGITKVKEKSEFKKAYKEASNYDSLVIAEEDLSAGEYTVTILDNQALAVVKIEPSTEFYDYEAKYQRNDTRYLCPAPLTPQQTQLMQADALKAFQTLGCSGWGRVDFLLDGQGKHYVLELNTAPGMTKTSLAPMAAAEQGYSFQDFVQKILLS